MMKRIVVLMTLLLPLAVQAQSFAGRASAEVDYRISKGLHVMAAEEIRSADSFSSIGSLRTTLGVSYKPLKFLKLGVGYTLINPYKTGKELDDGTLYNGFWSPKHRFFADVRGALDMGYFQFSLKERIQLTHNGDSGMNVYQNPRNVLALKSRLGIKYKGWGAAQPYVQFELRTALNGAWGSASGDPKTKKDGTTYRDYTPAGYTHVYNDRYRGELGLDWRVATQHVVKPYVLLDYVSEYELDTNKEGTRLFSSGYNNLLRISLGVSYTFNF